MAAQPDVASCVLAITDAGDVVAFASDESSESGALLRESAARNAHDLQVAVSIVRLEIPLPPDGREATVTPMGRVDAP